MAVHKRQVIERSAKSVVLNAEDTRCMAMRALATSQDAILFAYNCEHPAIGAHVENGGSAVVVEHVNDAPTIVARHSHNAVTPVVAVADIPATRGGAVLHNVHNALAATGIAWGLGIPVENITSGLAKFDSGVDTTPGRLNEIKGFAFNVLVDAAHNPHGIRHLVHYVDQRVVAGKKLIVFGARAQMLEETVRECAALIAGHFDLYILRNYRPSGSFGSLATRVIEVLREELLQHEVPESDISVVPGVQDAIDRGIECSNKGDLLVVQVPAGGNDKWDMIERIRGSEYRGQ